MKGPHEGRGGLFIISVPCCRAEGMALADEGVVLRGCLDPQDLPALAFDPAAPAKGRPDGVDQLEGAPGAARIILPPREPDGVVAVEVEGAVGRVALVLELLARSAGRHSPGLPWLRPG